MSLMDTLAGLRSPAEATEPMSDVLFGLSGEHLPHGYAFALEAALREQLPWLAEVPRAGVHPVRGPATEFGLMLSRRAKLVLRVPQSRVEAAFALSGRTLEVGEERLRIGSAMARPIGPFATLSAWNVASAAEDEAGFLEEIALQLEVMGVRARLICGRREVMSDGTRRVAGFGLALHELSPTHSLRVQWQGLGSARGLGCGVFVPHKIIEGLGAEPD